jgi:hypothetical protein
MANKINKPICVTAYGNTGFDDCFLEPGKIAGAIQVTRSFEIAEGDIEGLQAFLETKLHAAIGERIFPYHDFNDVTDNTEEPTINTTGYGAKIYVRDGFYDFTFRFILGGVQAHQEYAKNAGSNKYFLFYDDNGILYGYKSGGKLKGIPVDQFIVPNWRLPTGAEGAVYNLRFIINPKYMNKGNLGFLKVEDFNLFDLQGLQDVTLTLINIASNVATVGAVSTISNVELHDAYASNLADPDAWTATDENGDNVAITSVTDNAAADGWDVTFNSAAFNAADKVYLKLAAPATLTAAPISVTGFDTSQPLTIEAPAS